MKKYAILLCLFLAASMVYAQQNKGGKTYDTDSIEFEKTPILTWKSKSMINGKPSFNGFLLVKAKLNGVYDISGGLQESETFNVGKIDVYGTDDSKRFWMDMHQTQIRLWSERQTKDGPFIGYLEMDAWGGNNSIRLRHAWFDFKFLHFGQDWSFFGDKDVWPNVMDWDGPPSGVWRREVQLKFYWETEQNWKYEVGIEQPGAQISFINDIDPNMMEAYQNIPNFVGAIRKGGDKGHIRLSGVYRILNYKELNEVKSMPGYGLSLSGMLKTNEKYGNLVQFQVAAGKGIAAYLVSFDGLNYDAITTDLGNLSTVPAIGVWLSYEHYFSAKWHSNIVVGFSDFQTDEISEWEIAGEGAPGNPIQNTTIGLDHRYLLFNIMFDPTPGLTLGIEYNLGRKEIAYNGTIIDNDDPTVSYSTFEQGREAQRISFGAFFDF